MAKKEAEILGLEKYDVHDRPDGPAPTGKTWSFALGDWQDEDYLSAAPVESPSAKRTKTE